MARRKTQELDASSIADIAFLLLAFIIIATTLEKESGMQAFLPAKNKPSDPVEIIDRNVLEILVNKNNQLMIEGQWDKTADDVKSEVISFMSNPTNSIKYPAMEIVTKDICRTNILQLKELISKGGAKQSSYEKKLSKWESKLKTVELVGNYSTINKYATVAIQYDKATTYGTYLGVRDNIMSGINELRDNLALKNFLLNNQYPKKPTSLDLLKELYKVAPNDSIKSKIDELFKAI